MSIPISKKSLVKLPNLNTNAKAGRHHQKHLKAKYQRKLNLVTNFLKRVSPQKKTIFIVEDNDVYSKSLQGFLINRFPALNIKTFSFGEACLMELHLNPSVIIMDHLLNANLGGAANGLSIIKKIKSLNTGTNIILLSAQTELNVFVKALTEYDCDYLRKDEDAFHKVEQLIKKFIL